MRAAPERRLPSPGIGVTLHRPSEGIGSADRQGTGRGHMHMIGTLVAPGFAAPAFRAGAR